MQRKTTSMFAILGLAVLLLWQSAQANPQIDPPGDPPGLTNIFENVAPGTKLREGLPLGRGCSMGPVDLGNGYLNRSVYGAYAIGKGFNSAEIHCQKASGIFLYGDNDHYPLSQVCFDGACWTPPYGPNLWNSYDFQEVNVFKVRTYGDSGFFTLLVSAPQEETPTETPTPAETLTETPAPTPTGVVDQATPIPSPTPTPGKTTGEILREEPDMLLPWLYLGQISN